jgi:hypothetical protein
MGRWICADEQLREICPSACERPNRCPGDRAQVAVYASLTRVIECAPIQNKLAVFGLMAKTAASEVAALRQQYIDDLWLVAGDIRLIDLLGTASVQATLCAAFDPL